jgi:hypothetical protein
MIASLESYVHDSTRETLLCKPNIVQTKMAVRSKGAVVAAAVRAAAMDITPSTNITTSSFQP